MDEVDIETLVATAKAKVLAYMEPEVREDLERLAAQRNRSMSNLIETLVIDEIRRAIESGELAAKNSTQ